MKPAAVILVLSLGALAGEAAAQDAGPEPWAEAPRAWSADGVGDHFGACPAPWSPRLYEPIPDAFLWDDYRGAHIEHDLYRPRFLGPEASQLHPRRSGLTVFGAWLDSLFDWVPGRRHRSCANCQPSFAVNNAAPAAIAPSQPEAYAPPPTIREALPIPQPDEDREPVVAPVEPAPFQPVQPPSATQERPPANQIPPRLIPPRTPIVELAPEPTLPMEPPAAVPSTTPRAPAPPRNRVPRPGQQLPRNAVPR